MTPIPAKKRPRHAQATALDLENLCRRHRGRSSHLGATVVAAFGRQLGYDVESLTSVKPFLLFAELDQRGNGFITVEDVACESCAVRQALLRRIWVAAVRLQRSLCHAAAQPLASPVSPRPVLPHFQAIACSCSAPSDDAEGMEARQWQRRRHKTNVELQQRSLL